MDRRSGMEGGDEGGVIHGDVDVTHRAYGACTIVLHVQCCDQANGDEQDAVSALDDNAIPR